MSAEKTQISGSGGLSVIGHVTSSGNISASGNLSATGNLDIDGNTDVAGYITASGNLGAGGNIYGTGNLDIDGTANIAGDVNMQSDLDVTGTITAREIHTVFVSASVATATGSNVFGDDGSDEHQFTGSLFLSGANAGGTGESLIVESGRVGINTTLIRNNRFLHIAAPSQDYSNSSTQLPDGGGIMLQHTDP